MAMCKKCGGYIEWPSKNCNHCRTPVKWTAKQITLAILWKIFASVIVPIAAVALMKSCGE